MAKLSPLQMTDATDWKGLTNENHLGFIWQQEPQKASEIVAEIQQKYYGIDIEGFLSKYPTKEFEDDRDYYWEISSYGVDNIGLVEARVDGTAVTAASQAGLNNSKFDLVFPKDWFSPKEVIVGRRNETYPIRIVSARQEATNWVYTCELLTGDPNLFVPFEELAAGTLFSRENAPVSRTLSQSGREIKYRTHVSMRNAFSQIRIQKSTPGNMTTKNLGTFIKGENGKLHKMWIQHESFVFDNEFRNDINRILMFGTSNRTSTGDYLQKEESGYSVQTGSGLREQCEVSNTSFYTAFDIRDLSARLMDLSEGKLGMDERAFVAGTGERGAYQFHVALEDYSQLFTPLRNNDRMYSVSQSGVHMGEGYGGQFVEFKGFNGIKFNLSIMGMYDSRDRNKIPHPDGGVTESYRYDIWDMGTSQNGKVPNIQKVKKKGVDMIHIYLPGLRDPFSPTGGRNKLATTSKDGWEEHMFWQGGVMVIDPSRTAHFVYNGI